MADRDRDKLDASIIRASGNTVLNTGIYWTQKNRRWTNDKEEKRNDYIHNTRTKGKRSSAGLSRRQN
jgi:hypothetical protein